MLKSKSLVNKWFEIWENGNFQDLPLAESFKHTSPYGTIMSKKDYLQLVEANRDKFLNHKFIIHDEMYDEQRACIRYSAIQGDFSLEVTEWHFIKNDLIDEIIAYYNIDEARIKID